MDSGRRSTDGDRRLPGARDTAGGRGGGGVKKGKARERLHGGPGVLHGTKPSRLPHEGVAVALESGVADRGPGANSRTAPMSTRNQKEGGVARRVCARPGRPRHCRRMSQAQRRDGAKGLGRAERMRQRRPQHATHWLRPGPNPRRDTAAHTHAGGRHPMARAQNGWPPAARGGLPRRRTVPTGPFQTPPLPSTMLPPPPLCDIPSGCCFFTGPWTVTRASLRMLRRVALSVGRCGRWCRAGVVSAFAEPSGWCAGAVLVAVDAVCALAVPNTWRTEVVLVVAGVVRRFFLPTHLRRPPAVHNLPRCVPACVRPRCPTPPRALPTVHPIRSTTPWVARAHDAFLDGRG